MSKTNIQFSYDPETHTTKCVRKIKNRTYTGKAICHPNDYDFETTLVGQHYAYTRSMIMELCDKRNELLVEIRTLKHIKNIFEQNANVNDESTESYMIRRQIKLAEERLAETKAIIGTTRRLLRETIADKDKFYSKVRTLRKREQLAHSATT